MSEFIGKRYGKLLVLNECRYPSKPYTARGLHCKCDCGADFTGRFHSIVYGITTSCGCNYRLKLPMGTRFGKLVIIENIGSFKKSTHFRCKCDCGNECFVKGTMLTTNRTTHCGCDNGYEKLKVRKLDPQLYCTWKGVRARCNNPNNIGYKNYGGRGIKMCEEWNDFRIFYAWAMSNGYKRGLQLDRIDNDGIYSPSNCQFLTHKENGRKSRQVKLTYEIVREIKESTLKYSDLAKKYGVHISTIANAKTGKTWY